MGKLNYKLKSRKFLVWLVWTVFTFTVIITTKTINPELISWYGAISLIYISVNMAQKFVEKK